jgi:2'-5' RNA ligase
MRLRVVVLVPKDAQAIIAPKAKIAASADRHYFVVDGKRFVLHITLFDIFIQPREFKSIKSELALAARSIRGGTIKILGSTLFGNAIALKVVLPTALKAFRERQLGIFNRKGYKTDPQFLPSYRPHITLGKFVSNKAAKKAVKVLKNVKFDFKANKMAFTLVNRHGQFEKFITVFPLAK